jgi:hypothetical protein
MDVVLPFASQTKAVAPSASQGLPKQEKRLSKQHNPSTAFKSVFSREFYNFIPVRFHRLANDPCDHYSGGTKK